MRRVLIISPMFPPVNAPDMHRVRMSAHYFEANGWKPTVVAVDEQYVDGFKDNLLAETLPPGLHVVKIAAYPEKITNKMGIGSISLRSYLQYKKAVNKLLSEQKYDLVFFSTSQHHVCMLGKYWKKKFGIPFIVDMQDPWRNDFHLDKEKYRDSAKFRIAYKINKYMEARTMPFADGIISVSQPYIDTLKSRYQQIKDIPARTITFGASEKDFDVVRVKKISPVHIQTGSGKINVVYTGAVTPFFIPVISLFFEAQLENKEDLGRYHFYFIGTSYKQGSQTRMVYDLATRLGIAEHVTEIADRSPYFTTLATMQAADILFVPGSIDRDYNASKIYNTVLAGKPVFSIFNKQSSVIAAVEETGAGIAYSFDNLDNPVVSKKEIYTAWNTFRQRMNEFPKQTGNTRDFTADHRTREICAFFNEVVERSRAEKT